MFRVRTALTGPSGAPWLSTLYFSDAGAGDAQDAADAVAAFWGVMAADVSSSVTYTVENVVYVMSESTGEPTSVESVTGATGTGARVEALLPRQTQLLIQLRTGNFIAGREVRGRMFIPGLTEAANIAGGVPDPVVMGHAVSAWGALAGAWPGAQSVWSRRWGSLYDIAGITVWGQYASLRSRRD